jgi:hypothetical protein
MNTPTRAAIAKVGGSVMATHYEPVWLVIWTTSNGVQVGDAYGDKTMAIDHAVCYAASCRDEGWRAITRFSEPTWENDDGCRMQVIERSRYSWA